MKDARRWWGRRRIPFRQQVTSADCGAACLAMVLEYFGKFVTLDEAQRVCGMGRAGTESRALLEAGRQFHLRGRAVRAELEGVAQLPRGAVIHWDFRHWVVLDRLAKDAVFVVDPARGPRKVPLEIFRRSFTGVALCFEPGEGFETGSAPRGRYARYVQMLKAHAHLLAQIAVSSVLLRLLAVSVPVLTGLVVDRVIGRHDFDLLRILVIGAGGVIVFQAASSLVRSFLNLSMRVQLEAGLTLNFVDHLVRLPHAFFEARTPGDLMTRMSSNSRIRDILTGATLAALLDGTLATLYLVALFLGTWRLALVAIGMALCRVAMMAVIRHKNRALIRESLEAQSRTTDNQFELLSGIETLKASGAESEGAERWSNLYVDTLNVSIRAGKLTAVSDMLMGILDLGAPMLILLTGALEVMRGRLTLGQMLALNSLGMAVLMPLGALVFALTELQLLGGYLERIDDVFTTPVEQAGKIVRPAPKLNGAIQIEDVSFKYGSNAPLILESVSLEVEAGQCVAIVGRSGSGKSTLGRLLLGLYPPVSGKVRYDEMDLDTLDLRSVRRQCGVVTQTARLFSGSIKSVIKGHHLDASLREVVEAAALACVHDEILKMPLGYETPLSNGGGALSGGQRQRLALARALVHRPSVLLLDEATSSLDPVTEARIQTNLEGLRCTRILIAHRLSTVVNADRIFVVDGGRIVESGTHQELFARNGHYTRLVSHQVPAA